MTELDWLFAIADKLRSASRSVSIEDVLRESVRNGHKVLVQDAIAFARKCSDRQGYFILPDSVLNFLADFMRHSKPASILDASDGIGLTSIFLAERSQAGSTEVYARHTSVREILDLVSSNVQVSCRIGDVLSSLSESDNVFDVVFGDALVGMQTTSHTFRIGDKIVKQNGSIGELTLLKGCQHLNPGGVGLFVVPPNFFWSRSAFEVHRRLHDLGVGVKAVLSISPNLYRFTSIPLSIVVITYGHAEKYFIGQITGNEQHDQELLSNLATNMEGRQLSLGRNVIADQFHNYRRLETTERITRFRVAQLLPETSLTVIATEINPAKPKSESPFDDIENAVYVPLFPESAAVASLNDLRIKPENYLQIALNPSLASAEYVARFFNSELGRALREEVASGATISKITKSSTPNLRLFLPDIETQLAINNEGRRVRELQARLQQIQNRLLDEPNNVGTARHELDEFTSAKGGFVEWIDTLPFPLASILWAYHTSPNDSQRKYERLLHFFEALAEFHATVLLSGFKSSKALWEESFPKIVTAMQKERLTIERATFGTWKLIASVLSKSARAWMNEGPDAVDRCRKLFLTSRSDVLEMLLSRELIQLYDHANNRRNRWMGHGGIVGSQEADNRHEDLKEVLFRVRDIMADTWQKYKLIMPTSSIRTNIFMNSANLVMGVKTPFEIDTQVFTSEALRCDRLYLKSEESLTALEMLPLVRIRQSPGSAKNACYFFSRTENEDARFITYHFESDSEIIESATEIVISLRDILKD